MLKPKVTPKIFGKVLKPKTRLKLMKTLKISLSRAEKWSKKLLPRKTRTQPLQLLNQLTLRLYGGGPRKTKPNPLNQLLLQLKVKPYGGGPRKTKPNPQNQPLLQLKEKLLKHYGGGQRKTRLSQLKNQNQLNLLPHPLILKFNLYGSGLRKKKQNQLKPNQLKVRI